jgi:hypothetical protein
VQYGREAKLYKFDCSFNQTEWVWLQVEFVSDHLEFYEVGLKQLPCHAGGFYGLASTETPCSIWENCPLALPKQVPK